MRTFLIILGLALVLIGLAWPWLGRVVGRLPGDWHFGGDGYSVHILLGTSLLLSVLLTLLFFIINWFSGGR
ncbi:MAG TPA: DUF2905 family protein [Thermopetrobacter sp.]|nr:DUF2905 family protein [Thermopetrobacter sp.]